MAGAGLLFVFATTSHAQSKAEPLLLDVHVNNRPLPGIVRAERLADGRLALPVDLWAEARLHTVGAPVALSDGTEGHILDAVAGDGAAGDQPPSLRGIARQIAAKLGVGRLAIEDLGIDVCRRLP